MDKILYRKGFPEIREKIFDYLQLKILIKCVCEKISDQLRLKTQKWQGMNTIFR